MEYNEILERISNLTNISDKLDLLSQIRSMILARKDLEIDKALKCLDLTYSLQSEILKERRTSFQGIRGVVNKVELKVIPNKLYLQNDINLHGLFDEKGIFTWNLISNPIEYNYEKTAFRLINYFSNQLICSEIIDLPTGEAISSWIKTGVCESGGTKKFVVPSGYFGLKREYTSKDEYDHYLYNVENEINQFLADNPEFVDEVFIKSKRR